MRLKTMSGHLFMNEENENIFDTILLNIDINKSLNFLSERERRIIEMRYGLNEYSKMSYSEIGEIYNLSKGRIRMIHLRALKILRYPFFTKYFNNWIPSKLKDYREKCIILKGTQVPYLK